MKKIVLAVFLLTTVLFSGCGNKSEYYIPPISGAIKHSTDIPQISDETLKEIDLYLHDVVNWYNSVNIDEPQSMYFHYPIWDKGEKFQNIKEVKQMNDILSNYKVPPDDLMDVFKAYVPLIAIRGEVAGILLKSNMHLTIGQDESSPELEIDKKRWETLRTRILEAITFYYK